MRGNGPYVALALALLVGILIAYVDTRPTWDDTGVTAAAILIAAGAAAWFGAQPWSAAACVAGPLLAIELQHPNLGLVLVPPVALAGACGGWALRRAMNRSSH